MICLYCDVATGHVDFAVFWRSDQSSSNVTVQTYVCSFNLTLTLPKIGAEESSAKRRVAEE